MGAAGSLGSDPESPATQVRARVPGRHVLSENQSLDDLREKMRAYLANGSKVAVLIDPNGRCVEVHRPGRDPEAHRNAVTVTLGSELPGFVLDLGPVFED